MLSRNDHHPVDVAEDEIAGANGHSLNVGPWKEDRLGPSLHLPSPDRLNRRAVGGEGAELRLYCRECGRSVVWYGSSRVTGPQASMIMARACSAVWKP